MINTEIANIIYEIAALTHPTIKNLTKSGNLNQIFITKFYHKVILLVYGLKYAEHNNFRQILIFFLMGEI